MNFKVFFAGILIVFLSIGAKAQHELGLHFMKQVGQSALTNPAFISDHVIGVNLASPYINLFNTSLVVNDFLFEIPGTDSLRVDLDPAIERMDDKNNSTFYNLHYDILHLTYRWKNWQYSLSYSLKHNAYANYSKTFADVVWNGNGNYVGQNIEVGPDFQTFLYHEIAAGAAYQFDFGLSVGARVKYLAGVADFSASEDRQSIQLFTDDDIYQITLNTDYVIQSSSFPELDEDFQTIGGEVLELFPHTGNFGKNSGIAFDLGFEFDVNDKLSVAGSVINLGGTISWSENLNNYVSNDEFRYDGIDIGPLIEGDTLDFSAIGDTLSEIFDIQTSTNSSSYKSSLPVKYFLSASYDIDDDLRVGGLIYNETFRGHSHPAFAVFGQMDFLKDKLSLGASASYRNGGTFNLGINGVASIGPVQLFASTDNILSVFSPYQNKNANIRAGLNLLFFPKKNDNAPEE